MSAQMDKKQVDWGRHLASWRESGLSQAMYCRQQGLSYRRFCYRHRVQRRAGGAATPSPAAIPIVVSQVSSSDIQIALPNGLLLRVTSDVEIAPLTMLIKALSAC